MRKRSPAPVRKALPDEHSGIRRHAIRLAEPLAGQHADLITAALALVDDPDAEVQLQLANSLRHWPGRPSASALARLAIRAAADPYLTAAVTSSLHPGNMEDVLARTVEASEVPAARHQTGRLLPLSVAFETRSATLVGLESIVKPHPAHDLQWKYETLAEVLDALQRRGQSVEDPVPGQGDRGRNVCRQMAAVLDADTRHRDIDQLAALLTPQTSPVLQVAVIRHLGTLSDAVISEVLLNGCPSHGPWARCSHCHSGCAGHSCPMVKSPAGFHRKRSHGSCGH